MGSEHPGSPDGIAAGPAAAPRPLSVARVVEILVAQSAGSPPVEVARVRAVPGRGLEGDRYFNNAGTFSPHPQKPDFEVTLVQREHIEEFASSSGIAFSPRDARRNLVTAGVDLNGLVGREFRVGNVLIRGIRLCEPCATMAKRTSPEVLRGLLHKGGLRAQILSEGEIRVDDPLVEESPRAPERRGSG
jgi:MOSC domain-containing protein YiiM